MAERPIFIPVADGSKFVREISFEIPWASGFAPVQKKKNIKTLHQAAEKRGFSPLLEVSTKSDVVVGQHLSAFHLKVRTDLGVISLESAFQGSKVFERGGPYKDLYAVDAKAAKRDDRLSESGRLIRFEFDGHIFPVVPRTVFYDWLYLTAIYPYRGWLQDRLIENGEFAGFTDIEFNPSKSINCQARSCALFVALSKRKLLEVAMESPESFIEMMSDDSEPKISKESESRLSL